MIYRSTSTIHANLCLSFFPCWYTGVRSKKHIKKQIIWGFMLATCYLSLKLNRKTQISRTICEVAQRNKLIYHQLVLQDSYIHHRAMSCDTNLPLSNKKIKTMGPWMIGYVPTFSQKIKALSIQDNMDPNLSPLLNLTKKKNWSHLPRPI